MKQHLRNFRLVYALGLLLSLLAVVILRIATFDAEYPRLLSFAIPYFFSFITIGLFDLHDSRKKNKGKEILFGDTFRNTAKRDLLFNKVFYSLWLTIPNVIIYSLILKNHLSDWKYHSVVMYLVWFLFIILTIWLLKSPWYSTKQETVQNEQEEKTN